MFALAYPQKRTSQISIVDIGNAIAHFEEMGFAANAAPWDQYVAGDTSAISREAKVGAIPLLRSGQMRRLPCGPDV